MAIEKVRVPEGTSGNWSVQHFTVDRVDLHGMLRGRYVPEGSYTRLMRGGVIVMSDTPDEMRDHYGFIHQARGHCLINGLGLGMCLGAVLRKEAVTAVTVVEKSADVIALIADTYRDPRVQIVHADAFTYTPPKGIRYGAVWHDIWDDMCGDNLPQMHRLHRKYGRKADWQGSWGREFTERQMRFEQSHYRSWRAA